MECADAVESIFQPICGLNANEGRQFQLNDDIASYLNDNNCASKTDNKMISNNDLMMKIDDQNHNINNNVVFDIEQTTLNNNSLPSAIDHRVKPNSLLARMALPCQSSGVNEWDYRGGGECYSYYANGCYNTCQFVEFCDIEDFM